MPVFILLSHIRKIINVKEETGIRILIVSRDLITVGIFSVY